MAFCGPKPVKPSHSLSWWVTMASSSSRRALAACEVSSRRPSISLRISGLAE